MKNIFRYFKIWSLFTKGTFQIAFMSRIGAFLFTFAKLLRFGMFMLVVVVVVSKTKSLAGYSLTQSIIFFLTFNVIDTVTQMLFRDVYRFRQAVVSGYFDHVLAKPMSPLFKFLLGGADGLDLIVFFPYAIILSYFLALVSWSLLTFFTYLLLVINAMIISSAFHIFVLAMGIITTEIDHTIMIYRDVTSMARFPVDIYSEPLRGFITFVIPVGVMMTFPPKALFGLLHPSMIFVSMMIGISMLVISITFWRYSLSKYSSASS